MVSFREPVGAPIRAPTAGGPAKIQPTWLIIEPGPFNGFPTLPNDVLIVEDDPIIALDFEDTILGFGVTSVRSAGNVAAALAAIAERPPDFALLDVALARGNSFAVAEQLVVLKIPFVFVTGYGGSAAVPAAFAEWPRLGKPCAAEALEAAIRQSIRPEA